MIQAGGLIKLHYHNHFDVLEAFNDIDGILYYKDAPLFQNIQISETDHNHLAKKPDGLFVDGSFIDRFDYHDNELYFDNIIVSREYTNEVITNAINSLWTTDPYLEIGKIDLSYWFELKRSTDKTLIYLNNSDTQMNLLINNPHNQSLKIDIDEEITNSNSSKINIVLLSSQLITIEEENQEDLNEITVILQ